MKTVRAKFHCHQDVPGYGDQTVVHMHAVYSGEGENADFAKASPSGSFTIAIDGGMPAAGFFEQGKPYYLDITAAE